MIFARAITFVGIALLLVAWLAATFIPGQARDDFTALVVANGGSLPVGNDYAIGYAQMCAGRRMLQDFYVGAAGLVLLSVGLARWSKYGEL